MNFFRGFGERRFVLEVGFFSGSIGGASEAISEGVSAWPVVAVGLISLAGCFLRRVFAGLLDDAGDAGVSGDVDVVDGVGGGDNGGDAFSAAFDSGRLWAVSRVESCSPLALFLLLSRAGFDAGISFSVSLMTLSVVLCDNAGSGSVGARFLAPASGGVLCSC